MGIELLNDMTKEARRAARQTAMQARRQGIDLDQPGEYDKLSAAEQRAVLKEISAMIEPAGKVLHFHSTYSLKHRLSRYITNGAMKGACLALGFQVKDTSAKNWQLYTRFRGK